ncbi:uncharacterized protein LOC123527678 [Mercenaria mercenaria]|uniref:uncharacterized protein LOC123527678 n=1 Tax=Mercenaria mercenaria TaxID=6596 RepID=UPI00234F2D2B|nr:uncharacterized protein LOC123527678 [Mercenaria mercenaria]
MFGCKQGFFGVKCNETCSSLCIHTLCRQESGVCIKGCTGSKDDPVCLLEKPQDESDNKSTTTTVIILAILLALFSTALCILLLKKIIKKMRFTVRQTEESVIRNPSQYSQNEEVIAVTEVDNVAYEILDTTQGAPEHTYDTASHSVQESSLNSGDKEYMNLQIPKQ